MSLKNSKKKSGCFGKMPPGEILERLYCLYNKREYVDPDPLLFLYRYHERRDQELAAFVASSLAYGRVGGILRSVRKVLDPLGEHPADFLCSAPERFFQEAYSGFRHRFNGEEDIRHMLFGIRRLFEEYGTLEKAFVSGFTPGEPNILKALERFSGLLCRDFPAGESFLFPLPSKKSACKRLCLALRWLVRKDEVDCGVWTEIPPSCLMVPLDTHNLSGGSGEIRFCPDAFRHPSAVFQGWMESAATMRNPESLSRIPPRGAPLFSFFLLLLFPGPLSGGREGKGKRRTEREKNGGSRVRENGIPKAVKTGSG